MHSGQHCAAGYTIEEVRGLSVGAAEDLPW